MLLKANTLIQVLSGTKNIELRAQSCLLLAIEEEQSSVSLIDSETGTIASDSSDLDSDISCFGKTYTACHDVTPFLGTVNRF